ncbi:MAG: basic secretory protein-like protein [Planctomycetota bacterium]
MLNCAGCVLVIGAIAQPQSAPLAPITPAAPPAAVPATPTTPAKDAAPVAPEKAAPAKITITVEADEAPDLKEWAEKAKAICEEWYPKLAEELKSDGFTPRTTAKIVFVKAARYPAATGGGTITVNAEYLRKHMNDYGMMVHELAHVVQAYPRNKGEVGWLTEGIADYVRFWVYEPKVRQAKIDVKKASYKDSYRTSAAFLGWLVGKYDKEIVTKLNARMRKGGCDLTVFKDLTGKSVDDLWKEFVEAGAPSAPELPKAAEPTATKPEEKKPQEKK